MSSENEIDTKKQKTEAENIMDNSNLAPSWHEITNDDEDNLSNILPYKNCLCIWKCFKLSIQAEERFQL